MKLSQLLFLVLTISAVTIVSGKKLNEKCTKGNECSVEHSHCYIYSGCSEGKCACKDGYYEDNKACKKVTSLSNDAKCSINDKGNVCSKDHICWKCSGTTKCHKIPKEGHLKPYENAAECTDIAACNAVKGSICWKPDGCAKGLCSCKAGFYKDGTDCKAVTKLLKDKSCVANSKSKVCSNNFACHTCPDQTVLKCRSKEIVGSLGYQCSKNEECITKYSRCFLYSGCHKGQCQCGKGHYRKDLECFKADVIKKDKECPLGDLKKVCEDHSVCQKCGSDAAKCHGVPGKQPRSLLATECSDDSKCSAHKDSFCWKLDNCDTGKCACKTGFYTDNNTCKKVTKTLKLNENCTQSKKDEVCDGNLVCLSCPGSNTYKCRTGGEGDKSASNQVRVVSEVVMALIAFCIIF